MTDIQLRFNKDVLVIASETSAELRRLGIDTDRDSELTMLIEPEIFDDIYQLENTAGAQCFVTNTASITPARLAHMNMTERAPALAKAAIEMLQPVKPQHILAEIGPCGLPLDSSSKGSLVEHCDQYARAASAFDGLSFDAFFLNGFSDCTALRCALMGIRKVSDKPVFASVEVDGEGVLVPAAARAQACGADRGSDGWRTDVETIEDAVSLMAEYGAQVAGFCTQAPVDAACAIVRRMEETAYLPVLVQLRVVERNPEQERATDENPYFEPDTMMEAAHALMKAGAQFLRAVGDATPAYTGVLVASSAGHDVEQVQRTRSEAAASDDESIEERAMRLRAKVSDHLKAHE